MRDSVVFYLNHERVEISGDEAFLTVSTWLRERRGLTGTKVVCAEGDCGACTVILGWMSPERKLEYRIIDSCIQFLHQLDCCHLITIECLAEKDSLHPAQQAMVDCFGSQCGFCTPGFVMALAHLAEEERTIDATKIREKLTGNLCRCTGYEAIVKSGLALNGKPSPGLLARFDRNRMETEFVTLAQQTMRINTVDGKIFVKPQTLTEALQLRGEMPQLKILAGGTDLGVQHNKGRALLHSTMFIAHLHDIGQVKLVADTLEIGAAANWSDVLRATKIKITAFYDILSVFAAEQIRNAATIGGNIINASPIADSLPCLFVLEAKLVLSSTNGAREVAIKEFYKGYKQFDLKADELLTKIILPLPKPNHMLGLYKVSKRRDLDISTATLGIYVGIEKEKIVSVELAAGGVAATIVTLPKAVASLVGATINAETFTKAGEIAADEINPLSDVRGSAEFRKLLIKNLFAKFYTEHLAKVARGA